jgi:hypothetical protein
VKIKPEHFEALKAMIVPHDTENVRDYYRSDNLANHHDGMDRDMRYRWDLFWHVKVDKTPLMRELYEYLNDSHIDSALKAIVPKL